jgi:hypothetical protein
VAQPVVRMKTTAAPTRTDGMFFVITTSVKRWVQAHRFGKSRTRRMEHGTCQHGSSLGEGWPLPLRAVERHSFSIRLLCRHG